MNSTLFSSLALPNEMLKNLTTLGYEQMTPIQAKSLPAILENQDIIARAKTGCGKTAAFGIGLLMKIDPTFLGAQALVICPTRELADQVSQEIRRLARFTPNLRVLLLCGGKPVRMQAESLRYGAHIIVGTPGRIQDHIQKNTLNLHSIQTLVLDEADRMLDMGFYDNIIEIINVLPKQRQTLLFSATYPNEIREISAFIQHKAIEIADDSKEDTQIEQIFYQVSQHEKDETLTALLQYYMIESAIIFCNTKRQCDDIAMLLNSKGYAALAIHSDLEQRDRDEVLIQFANHSCSILVATDVAARGLDIKDLPVVINYDLPFSPEIYIHRIGRTGRAGKSGRAFSFFSNNETYRVNEIEEITQLTVKKENKAPSIKKVNQSTIKPPMRTLCINGGKKNKIRPADILGALTGEAGVAFGQVGKINIFDFHSYVAVNRDCVDDILIKLNNGKIKGRSFKVRCLEKGSEMDQAFI